MAKFKKRSFEELVMENKKQLLQDEVALQKIEDRLEEKILKKVE